MATASDVRRAMQTAAGGVVGLIAIGVLSAKLVQTEPGEPARTTSVTSSAAVEPVDGSEPIAVESTPESAAAATSTTAAHAAGRVAGAAGAAAEAIDDTPGADQPVGDAATDPTAQRHSTAIEEAAEVPAPVRETVPEPATAGSPPGDDFDDAEALRRMLRNR